MVENVLVRDSTNQQVEMFCQAVKKEIDVEDTLTSQYLNMRRGRRFSFSLSVGTANKETPGWISVTFFLPSKMKINT
ncbi:hypothetical protein RUM43_002134 [Polyplax serrata]|uniref:Uncharacterized protein n=1 Tax=Polyplax serrata TaxID=468196 RepID=A0AAN8PDE2_POLSC